MYRASICCICLYVLLYVCCIVLVCYCLLFDYCVMFIVLFRAGVRLCHRVVVLSVCFSSAIVVVCLVLYCVCCIVLIISVVFDLCYGAMCCVALVS